MDNLDLMNYWYNSANEDYNVMEVLFNNKKNSHALFFGHLTIEKMLKAIFAMKNESNPYALKSHDLLLLAEKDELEMTERQKDLLDIITRFNLNARYDDYKREFYKKCTDEYTSAQIENIKEVRQWLIQILETK
ncbi:MAG: HEPN domain-containing protein [Clostridia bacterium]|nr:HEPN domain-containing protein [Clostridia bacterium]